MVLRSKNKLFYLGLIVFVVFYIFFQGFQSKKKISHDKKDFSIDNNKKKSMFLDTDYNIESLGVGELVKSSKFSEIFQEDSDLPVRTNQWFSSLYFKSTSEQIFMLPLAIKFTKVGFEISKPNISSSKDLVQGFFQKNIEFTFKGERDLKSKVIKSSDFSVLVGIYNKENKIASVTLTKGSPFIFIELDNKNKIKIISNSKIKREEDFYKTTVNNNEFGIFFDNLDNINSEKNNVITKDIKDNSLMSIGFLPDGISTEEIKKASLNPIIDTKVSFTKDSDKYINIFSVITRDSKDTLWGLLPHHLAGITKEQQKRCFLENKIDTIRGKQTFCKGNIFRIKSNQNITPKKDLDFSKITNEQKKVLIELVKKDVNKFNGFKATDTYFLGKELLKIAQLYSLCENLGLDKESKKLNKILVQEFNNWRSNTINKKQPSSGKYFVYDNLVKGIVGYNTSFGSEKFNDHHFHYGYFIQAASIIARYDSEFLNKNKEFINLILRDYMNLSRNDNEFPIVRNFDFYEGHSWASGTALFGDGNNQESSSEAIQAYYGAFLWGNVIKNENIKEIGRWLYNQEVDSSLTYWFLATKYSPKFTGYKHSLFSMIWSAKDEFSTWFSAEPEAKVGIELIPFTPGSQYLKEVPEEIIRSHLDETSFPKHKLFFDQLLMYDAIQNKQEALNLFKKIKEKDLDDGDTLSFLYAWLITI